MTFSREGGAVLIHAEGRSLHLNSSRPEAEAEKLLSSLSPAADALFLGGVGLGWVLEKALEFPRLKWIFAIEPSPEIAALALEIRPQLAQLKKNPRVVWIESPEALSERLRDFHFTELALIISRTYGELYGRELALYQKIFSGVLSRKEVSKNTLVRFGKTWVKNFFRNMPLYLKSTKVSSFSACGENKPALIIGAGPSLDEALPYIKKASSKAFLIAADTALPMLEASGISPDFVASIDPQEANSLYLRYAQGRSHYLIADPGLHSSSFEGYSSENIALSDAALPFYESFRPFWGSFGALASGGSVSTSAFDFARAMGCSPIILAGQDLSFTERKSYSSGNILWELGRAKYTRLNTYHNSQARSMYPGHTLMLKGRKGTPVPADARFAAFAGWFSEEIPKTSAPVYTAGLEGAYLEGARHLGIPEAFALLKEDIDKGFKPAPECIEPAPLIAHLQKLKGEALCLLRAAQKAKAAVQKGASFFKESSALQRLLSAHPACTRIVEIGIQGSVWKALSSEGEAEEQASALIYEIEESLRFFLRLLEKTLRRFT